MLWVIGTSWLASLAAAAYAIATGLTQRHAGRGLALGLALCAATAAAMFPAPEVFAFVLGCMR
jgi:fucose permease